MSFNRKDQRIIRHRRLRQRVHGTAVRPRMAIFVSNRQLYVQFIDDAAGCTLAHTSSGKAVAGCNLSSAKQVGALAAEAALAKGLRQVVVDRGGFRFHGRVKQLVEAAVAGGLKITNDATGATEVTK
ncbi:MAG: 50S ribosomal protein L18 [bacterium]